MIYGWIVKYTKIILKYTLYYIILQQNNNIKTILLFVYMNSSTIQVIQSTTLIPFNIFQTWHTKDLTPKMLEAINAVKEHNPEFSYHLYDDANCLDFITTYFDKSVVDAYNTLLPGAYKADLWRYCVLYIHGGVYLDIKYYPVNGFKFLELVKSEHFVKDREHFLGERGVYNGLIISKPNNQILWNCIRQIVHNVNTQFYGKNPFEPTGPLLVSKFISDHMYINLSLLYEEDSFNTVILLQHKLQKTVILRMYADFREEQFKLSSTNYYQIMWINKTIYKKSLNKISYNLIENNNTQFINENKPKMPLIPLNIFQTWHTKDLPPIILEAANSININNPEFTYHLYDEVDCLHFITTHFDKSVSDAYNSLVPHSYKADLWRFCILYIHGGIYLDIKFYPVNGFKFLELTDQEYFAKDIEVSGGGVLTGLIITKPKNTILLNCIHKIVENVKNNYYGSHCLEPTGPLLLKQCCPPEVMNNNSLRLSDNGIQILFNNKAILEFNREKYHSIKFSSQNYYNNYITLWNLKQIYNNSIFTELKVKTPVIPFNIFQTWHTKDLPPKVLEAANSIITNNPAFIYYLYDANDCLDFIKNNFNNDVFEAYQNLIPYSYKSDLWKYCILYINGGIYLDICFYNITNFNFVEIINQEYFVNELKDTGGGIYNGFMVVKPRNQILLNCIHKIVENVKNKCTYSNPHVMTGSLLLKQFFNSEQLSDITINLLQLENSTIGIEYNNKIILQKI